jgi:hypothetical protein
MSEIKRATRNRIRRLEVCVEEVLAWSNQYAEGADKRAVNDLHNRVSRTARAIRPDTCEWKHDEHHDAWDTECDEKFQFTSDGPQENGMLFCPFCGASLVLQTAVPDAKTV